MIKPAVIPDAPFGSPPHSRPASLTIAAPDDGDGWEHRRTHAADAPPTEPARLTKSAKRRATLRSLADVQLESIRWLWPDHIPAGLFSLIASRPGCGKTTLACEIGARITTGDRWPDGAPNHARGSVIFWSQEDPAEVLRTRAQAAGADLAKFHVLEGSSHGDPFSFDRHHGELVATMDDLGDLRLLILDPALGLVERGDGHDAANVRRALGGLVRLCAQRGVALLGVSHFAKGTAGNDPLERVLGSQAWGAMARLVWVLSKDAGRVGGAHDRLMIRAKSNISRDVDGWRFGLTQRPLAEGISGQGIEWGEAVKGDARSILAQAEANETGEADTNDPDAELIALLRALLADGPKSAGEIFAEMDAAGFARWQVKKVKRRAGVVTEKDGMSAGWSWRLAEGSALPKSTSLRVPSQPFAPLHAPSDFPPFPERGEG